MELFRKGRVISLGKTYIIFETNRIGKIIYVANPENFVKGNNIKLFTYLHKTDYSESLYGFENFNNRVLFENLLSVSGIGPKTTINILKAGAEFIMEAISDEDIKKLSTVQGLGIRTAKQIIFELAGKYKNIKAKKNGKVPPQEIKNSLRVLGFNDDQIKYAVDNLEPCKTSDEMIEKAIVLISNAAVKTQNL